MAVATPDAAETSASATPKDRSPPCGVCTSSSTRFTMSIASPGTTSEACSRSHSKSCGMSRNPSSATRKITNGNSENSAR